MYFLSYKNILLLIITRTRARAVDRVQDLESRGQWFESQARQVNPKLDR